MARGDRRLSTDDLTGRFRRDRPGPDPAEEEPGREEVARDERARGSGTGAAGADITEVRTEGGQVHVERDRSATTGAGGVGAGGADARGTDEDRRPLLDPGEADDFRRRWESVQAAFVDEPRHAVEEADALVAGVMQRMADSFSAERRDLESRWDRGDDVDTEALRVALQRYRSFFNRLLST